MVEYGYCLKFQKGSLEEFFCRKNEKQMKKIEKMSRNRQAQAQKSARSEFSAAIAQIAAERKIEPQAIYEAIEAGLLSAYRKQISGEQDEDLALDPKFFYVAKVDRVTGGMEVWKAPKLHPEDEDDDSYDEKKMENVTPAGFGRIAAQVAKQVIIQRVRDAERDQIIVDYSDKIGTLVTGQVLRMEGKNVLLDIGRGNAYMPPKEQMRGEFYKSNARLAVYIKAIDEINKRKAIIVSRADAELVRLLFEREVPEISAGTVMIKLLAREAGVRTKAAVVSNGGTSVDPVGSCVGQRGVRVQEIIKELNNEKIDIIPYYEDINLMIAAALSPAENLKINYDDKTKSAEVIAPADQISLTIGRGGQNVRLAAKLLGISITVKSEDGSVTAAMSGTEEYEIDSYGLDEEAREELVDRKLTTYADILRFTERINENEKLTEAQKELILAKAAEAEKAEMEKKEKTEEKE